VIIKKYQAETETEAILLAREELGKDAIVMNIKSIKPKGIYRLLKKPLVELTAAVDDTTAYNEEEEQEVIKPTPKPAAPKTSMARAEALKNPDIIIEDTPEPAEETAIEKRLNDLQKLLETQLVSGNNTGGEEKEVTLEEKTEEALPESTEEKNAACIRLVYDRLLDNEMDEKYVKQIISEVEKGLPKEAEVNTVLSGVYQKIILKLGSRKTIEPPERGTKFLFFVGPTGVGKTTTIAKLASEFALKKKVKVAFIAADTYRIAAVEQLKTYASILNVPIQPLYSPEDMKKVRQEIKNADLVFVDTAGRSHQNMEQREDIERLLASVSEAEREVYLVLSATTKYRDLLKIADCYSEFTKYSLIFTKLDETSCIGNIFNLKMYTGMPLSYTTFGQNVPDDIGIIDAQSVAKKMLGGND
jgi:flagellar biosynthesis protein FlhF